MQAKVTILIIEDEKNICDFIATTLKAQGYKTITTGLGREGISLTASQCPDVILLDLGLPDVDEMCIRDRFCCISAGQHAEYGGRRTVSICTVGSQLCSYS